NLFALSLVRIGCMMTWIIAATPRRGSCNRYRYWVDTSRTTKNARVREHPGVLLVHVPAGLEPVLDRELHDAGVAGRVGDPAVGQAGRTDLHGRIGPVRMVEEIECLDAKIDALATREVQVAREGRIHVPE